jgi:3',5'-cyclic AMP phosphodiesterase CpdA
MSYRIVHLSDIHYGPPFQAALEPVLLEAITAQTPDLVVVSGDLTQRARTHQFRQASAFLARLPQPYLVIPGNHDVPLYNVFDRLFRPLERYKALIRPEVDMVVQVRGLLAVGLNSAYGWTNDGGRITPAQLELAARTFATSPSVDLKVLVTHHHFARPADVHQGPLPEPLLSRFAGWGVELVLVGHTHLSHVEQRPEGLVLVQSGTATANRWKKLKKRTNSFNRIDVDDETIRVEVAEYEPARRAYVQAASYRFPRPIRQA